MASGHQRVPHQQAGHMAAPTSTALPSKHPLPTGSRPHMAEGVEKVRAIKFCATIVRVSRAFSNIDSTKSRILNDCFKNFELPDFFNTLG